MAARTFIHRAGLWAAVAIVCNLFVIVAVNVSIYWARATYSARHPEETAIDPPTISGALSDPFIGEPFGGWVTLSAILLMAGVTVLTFLFLTALPPKEKGLRRLALAVLPFQLLTSAGMVVLSQYTFPHYNFEHMVGSYVAFLAETVVVALQTWLSIAILRRPDAAAALERGGVLHPAANRLRPGVGGLCVLTAVAFASLFFIKDFDLGAWNGVIRLAYVSSEPAFITLSLLTLLTYTADLSLSLRRPKPVVTEFS